MDPSQQRRRRIQTWRLWALLTIALVGYEIVLHRHWLRSVPLLPSQVLELKADDRPIGFVGADLFAIARQQGSASGGRTCGPVLLHQFPGNRTLQILSSKDEIRWGLPLYARWNETPTGWNTLTWARTAIAHPTPESAARSAEYLILDERRVLSIADDTLQCLNVDTDRVEWATPGVRTVSYIEANLAVVSTLGPQHSPGDHDLMTSLLDLDNGRLLETVGPVDYHNVQDVSHDRKWMVVGGYEGTRMWSIPERRAIWRKYSYEIPCTLFRFSADGQTLNSASIDESGVMRPVQLRTSDGERISETAGADRPISRASSAVALLGSRFAAFHMPARRNSGLPVWLEPYAVRWGWIDLARPHPSTSLICDTEHGQLAGMLDTMHGRLISSPRHEGFAIERTSGPVQRLEIYTLPPRSDWTWWILRGLVLPLPLIALAVRLHHRELRTKADDQLTAQGTEPLIIESPANASRP